MSTALYGFPVSPFVRSARAALAFAGVKYDFNEIAFDHLGTAEYRALNPFGKMPTLVADGFVVYETPAILRYVDEALGNGALQPQDAKSRATMQRWISIGSSYLYPSAVMQLFLHRIMLPIMGGSPDEAVVQSAVAATAAHLDVLESELAAKPVASKAFIVGDNLSLADIVVASMLDLAALTAEGAKLIADRPHVRKFLSGMRADPTFAATFPAMLEGKSQTA